MPNISFDSGMPIIEGTWYNPKTGDSFTARDTFFEDNNLIVMTTDGRRMNYNLLQNYVKSDKPIKMDKPKPKPQTYQSTPVEPATFDDNILDDDLKAIYGVSPVNNYATQEMANPVALVSRQVENELTLDQMTLHIIETAIGECELPKFKVDIDWTGIPKDEIAMLVKMMKITPKQIAEYVTNKINLSDAYEAAAAGVSEFVENCIAAPVAAPVVEPEPEQKQVPAPKPAAKAPAKPAKKKAPAKPAKKKAPVKKK